MQWSREHKEHSMLSVLEYRLCKLQSSVSLQIDTQKFVSTKSDFNSYKKRGEGIFSPNFEIQGFIISLMIWDPHFLCPAGI